MNDYNPQQGIVLHCADVQRWRSIMASIKCLLCTGCARYQRTSTKYLMQNDRAMLTLKVGVFILDNMRIVTQCDLRYRGLLPAVFSEPLDSSHDAISDFDLNLEWVKKDDSVLEIAKELMATGFRTLENRLVSSDADTLRYALKVCGAQDQLRAAGLASSVARLCKFEVRESLIWPAPCGLDQRAGGVVAF